jgi:DNA polymerase-1
MLPQNIPVGSTQDVSIRNAFVSDKKSTFVAFDYSQQELRILAALAGEDKMIESFNNGEDIHLLTASELFGKDPSEISKDDRRVGKIVNFSIVYGVSSFGLSENLRIGRAEAQNLIDSYYDTYKEIAKYFDAKKKDIHTKGFAETVLGRRRINGMGNSRQWFVKNAVERELINFGIQGSAADLMKLAMVDIEKVLSSYDVELLLQIHDEFLFEYKGGRSDKKFKSFTDEVKTIMEGVKDIGVSYKVDVKVGNIWGNMEEIT